MRYEFYKHKRLGAWRLVKVEGAAAPPGCRVEEFELSRVREADDTGQDIRAQVAQHGFVLFKLGGDFDAIDHELQVLDSGERERSRAPALEEFPVHLGRSASVVSEPRFAGDEWYEHYGTRHVADGFEGRLVSMFTFTCPWDTWEVHPHGSELVLCTAGEMTILQEVSGKHVRTELCAGHYAINPPGIWHTADVAHSATAVFITAGAGTQNRPR